VALQSGSRRSELLNLRWSDIDMRAHTVTFRLTKNGDSRTIPMTTTLRELLHAVPARWTTTRMCCHSAPRKRSPTPSATS
jgi:integrase